MKVFVINHSAEHQDPGVQDTEGVSASVELGVAYVKGRYSEYPVEWEFIDGVLVGTFGYKQGKSVEHTASWTFEEKELII